MLSFTPDGSRLVTWEARGPIRLWNLSGECLLTAGREGKSGKYIFSPDSARLMTWFDDDPTATLWDGRTGSPVATLDGHTGEIYNAEFAPDSTFVITGAADRTARVEVPKRVYTDTRCAQPIRSCRCK